MLTIVNNRVDHLKRYLNDLDILKYEEEKKNVEIIMK